MPRPPTPVLKPVTSWSFSRWSSYNECPQKFKFSALMRLPEPKGDALVRGDQIHKAAEAYIKGDAPKLAPELASFKDEFKRLRTKRRKSPDDVIVEDNWAFTHIWGPSRWDDWNGCWVRIKLDLAEVTKNEVLITDWKTGKFRPENSEQYMLQQELYGLGALLTFSHIPEVKVSARLAYTDAGVVYPDPPLSYTMADLPKLQKDWEKRVKPMFVDKKYAPKPNNNCRWCHFRKANNGPCQY
jgi:hypothetical protein